MVNQYYTNRKNKLSKKIDNSNFRNSNGFKNINEFTRLEEDLIKDYYFTSREVFRLSFK